jgi:hypothetical protein
VRRQLATAVVCAAIGFLTVNHWLRWLLGRRHADTVAGKLASWAGEHEPHEGFRPVMSKSMRVMGFYCGACEEGLAFDIESQHLGKLTEATEAERAGAEARWSAVEGADD